MTRRGRATEESAELLYERGLALTVHAAREAVKLFERAARLGNADAQLSLGVHFRDGRGVRKNLKKARDYFELAAQGGAWEALNSLGRFLLQVPRSPQERERGLQLLHRAFAKGDWSAPHFLGLAAENVGDWRTAEKWYRRAIKSGDLVSGMRLAKHYLDQMEERRRATGIALLKETIRHSEIDPAWAYTELAKCHLHGTGVPRSRAKATALLRRAAPSDPEARALLETLESRKR